MKYSPKGNPKTAIGFCMLAAACVLVFVVMSAQNVCAPWISQLGMIIAAVIAVQVYLRYILSNYTYYCDAGKLVIDKIVGKKIVPLGALDLGCSLSEAIPKSEYAKNKNAYPKVQMNLNYCKTMYAPDPYVYIFSFNGKTAMLAFEPSDEFVFALNRNIRICRKKSTKNINDDKKEEE